MYQKPIDIYSRTISVNPKDSLWVISELISFSSKVLDIGTASGALGEYLSTKKHCQIDGIEKNPQLAEVAMTKYRKLYVLDVETSLLADTISDDRYEFIVLADVLEHLREPSEVLKQIPSLMSEDGHLLLSVPNIGHAGVIAGLLSGEFRYRDDGLLDSTHVRFFTRSSLCELLESHGFEILSINPLRKDIRETEFKDHFLDIYAPALVRTVLAQPDALTYQFIVDVVYRPYRHTGSKRASTLVNIENNQLFFGCQLFWKSKQEENYSASQSSTGAGVIGDIRQSIQLNFPYLDVPPEKIRLDLSDRPGLINLYSMRLIAANGEILWEWQEDIAYLVTLKSAAIEFFSGNCKHCLLITGEDSQIELDIPDDSLRKVTSGASFIVELGWPMSADFAAILNSLSEVGYRRKISQLQSQLNCLINSEVNIQSEEAKKLLEVRNFQLETNVAELRMINKKQAQTIDRFRHQLDAAFLGISNLEKVCQVMETSSSWRMTAPMRWARRQLGHVRHLGPVLLRRYRIGLLLDSTHGNIEYAAVEQNALELSGWFFSTKDSSVKLYATVNGQNESPLVYGYERPDVSKLFPGQQGALKSGFSGIVALRNCDRGIASLDIWVEFDDGSKQKCFSRRINLGLASLLVKHYLNLGLALLSKWINYSYRFLEPTLPNGIHGHLDTPQPNAMVEQNVLNISGWILATKSPITKLYATINGKSESPLVHGYDRPDVFKLFPEQANSLNSGFSGITALQSHGSGIIMLDIWVELEDGSKHKCFCRRITNNCTSSYSLPPLKMLEFLRTVLKKAWDAYKQGRLPTSPAECWQAVRRSYIWTVGVEQRQMRSQTGGRIAAIQDPYQQWIETNRIGPKLRKLMESDAQRLATAGGAKISLVVPVYNAPRAFLEEMIESVATQIYPNWELCLADDASTKPYVREVLEAAVQADPRIRVKFRSVNGHICETTNDALSIATGDFVALLDHDDTLPPDALLHVAECVHQYPEVDWIYTDEDKIDAKGRRYDPQFKGAWSPEMAITHNYTHHLTVIRKELMAKVGGTRKGFEGAQDLDLFLRVAENTTADRIRHIPQICYHWRSHEESTASHGTQKNYIFDSAQRAIKQALERRKLDAEPVLPELAEKYGMCLYQLRWNNALGSGREVTIAIPTKDRGDLLKQCVDSLRKTVDWRFVRLLIVDDRSSDPATLKYLRELENDQTLQCKVIHPEDRGDGFNYARLINQAARHVETPYFLQLNNDVEAMHPGWLEDMMGWMSVEGVGIVGARLIYPDHTLQHAGVIVGPHGGLADHQFHLVPDMTVGYLALPHAARNVSAVTGACLLTSTDLFREIGGFDEQNFAVEYNDVDFCLRILAHGKRIVYSPQATLCHVTSASRGKAYNPKEHLNFVTKYRGFKDPFFNRSMMPDEMWMTINGGYVVNAERMQKLKVLFVVHALTLTGAPIVTYELARHLSEATGFNVSVVSMQDGPVRERFEDSGMPVRVLTDFPDMWRMNAADAQAALKAIGEEIDIAAYDLVVSNTLVCFWGVLAADMFKVPSMWNIHESVAAASYCSMFVDISMGELVATAFTKAGRTVFQAEATRRMYDDFDAYGRFRTIPGGMSLARIAEYRAAHDKDALRQQYGIDRNKRVVTLIGTTCERKGQAVFLDSIKLLETKFAGGMPDDLEFLLVGAIEGLYLDMLKKTIARHGWKNVHLIGETKEIYDYYVLSDIFVCASFEESFPMVILLAMAFELPIVSTNVFGIPEIVSDGHEAALMPPGNPALMADALYLCLTDRKNAEAMADRAYAKLHRLFDNSQLHARYAGLAQEVAMEDVYEAPVDEALVD